MNNSCQHFLTQLCHKLCTYFKGYLLEAPREYVPHGLVLGLDWASGQLSSTYIFFVCPSPPCLLLFVSTIPISHMHPLLPTRRLSTCTQVNNMAMLHHMYMGTHIYITFTLLSIPPSYFFHSFGQAGWPRHFLSVTNMTKHVPGLGVRDPLYIVTLVQYTYCLFYLYVHYCQLTPLHSQLFKLWAL